MPNASQPGAPRAANATTDAALDVLRDRATTPPPTTTAIAVLPSQRPTQDEAIATGSVAQAPHENTYTHVSHYYLHGKRYKFTLTCNSKEELERALIEFRNTFLGVTKSHLSNLPPNSKIKWGDNFHFIFTEQGYVIYSPKAAEKFNPEEDNIEDIEDAIVVTSEPAKELSDIVHNCCDDPKKMLKALNSTPSLAPFRETDQKTAASKTRPLRIVGLKNLGNTCYLNCAFQKLATNPLFRSELLKHPEVLKEGQGHPLYKAMKEYDDDQQIPEGQKVNDIDLEPLLNELGLRKEKQLDAQEAELLIYNQIDFAKLNSTSPLYSVSRSHFSFRDQDKEVWVPAEKNEDPGMAVRSFCPVVGKSIKELLKEQMIGLMGPEIVKSTQKPGLHKKETYPDGPPGLFSLHVKRTDWDLSKFPGSEKGRFIDALMATKKSLTHLSSQFKGNMNPHEKGALADQILADKDKFTQAHSLLALEEQKHYSELTQIKVTTPVDIPPELELPGDLYEKENETTCYELMSFVVHLGEDPNHGHYVIYVRDGDRYLRKSDNSETTVATPEELLEAKKNVTSLFYNRKDLVLTTSNQKSNEPTDLTDGDLANAEKESFWKTNFVRGVGNIAKRPGATIVNFTNITLDQETAIHQAAELGSEIHTLRENKKGRIFNQQGLFKNGDVVPSSPGILGKNGVKGIFHVVMIPSPSDYSNFDLFAEQLEKLIIAALTKAQEQKAKHIAFGLPEGTKDEWTKGTYERMCNTIKNYASTHRLDLERLDTIELVLTQMQHSNVKAKADDKEPSPSPTPLPKSVEPMKAPTPPPSPAPKIESTSDQQDQGIITAEDLLLIADDAPASPTPTDTSTETTPLQTTPTLSPPFSPAPTTRSKTIPNVLWDLFKLDQEQQSN